MKWDRAAEANAAVDGNVASVTMAPPDAPTTPQPTVATITTHAVIPAIAAAAALGRIAMDVDSDAPPLLALPPATTLAEHVHNLSKLVWNVDELRPMQKRTMEALYELERVICIDRTGGGKSHIIRLLGTLFKGVHLIFHPILSLTGDQLHQFQQGCQDYGLVSAINLDEIANSTAVKKKVIKWIQQTKKNSTATKFFFISPQYLVKHADVRNTLLKCARNGVLRSITIDEAHLWAQHGTSFRYEIRHLQKTFFQPIYSGNGEGPLFLATSATVSLSTVASISNLTAVGFPHPNRVVASAEDFGQHYITMQHKVSHEYTKSLDAVVDYAIANPTGCAFVFVNSKAQSHRIVPKLEAKLDMKKVTADLIHIHGSVGKKGKLKLIKLFVQTLRVAGFEPRVLVATSSADVGIHHKDGGFVIIIEWPSDLATYVQRRGRTSRRGQPSIVIVVAGVSAYLSLIRRIYRQTIDDDDDEDEDNNIAGFNTLITPRKKHNNQRGTTNNSNVNRRHEESLQYRLKPSQKKHLRDTQLNHLVEVIDFFSLNRGCQHARIQEYLATGKLPIVTESAIRTCDDACGICSGSWHLNFLPVYKDAVVAWFNSVAVRDAFPMDATMDNLFGLLWGVGHWVTAIFDKGVSTVNKYNVESFFLQLIGSRIIEARLLKGNLKWVFCHERVNEYTDILCYTKESYRTGVQLHPLPHNRNRKYKIPG